MRVLLVRPPSVLGRMSRQNLQHPTNLVGLASEASARGHEAGLLDLEVTPGGEDAFRPALDRFRPDVLGVSVVTPHVPGAARLLEAAKSWSRDLFTVAGGPHATALPADLLDEIPALDAVCVGEGDRTLPELLDARADGAGLGAVPGLHLRDGGFTGHRDVVDDLDTLAPLDRTLLDWPAYAALAGRKGVASPGVIRRGIRAAQVHLSRGCYARCVFCSTNAVWGERARPGIRRRSVGCVLAEIDELAGRWGINHLNFEDDIFPPTLRYLEELCEALIPRKLTWSCNARVDGLRREHFELMAASGCLKIDFGVESGSERILELNQKLVTRERVVHVFAEAKRVGILRTAYLMLGSHVDETPEEVELTRRLAHEIRPDYLTFTVGCPYPGTQLWDDCKQRGYLDYLPSGRPDWKRYGYYPGLPPWRFTHFSAQQMLDTQRRFLRGFYLSPRFVLRMLGRVRSLEQLQALVVAGLDVTHFLSSGPVGRLRRRVGG
ncbi:MAG: B12-binding domain-containing radical SAM protein [Planctomycetes bacterium]|nr:B12-binding domain-containing radical SAM protein [Planctomycetota bacterium]